MKILREHKWIYELEMLNFQFQLATRARDEREFKPVVEPLLIQKKKSTWWLLWVTLGAGFLQVWGRG